MWPEFVLCRAWARTTRSSTWSYGPVATAVGFAGTVQGMIVAFSLLGGDVSPEMINMMSQGIFVALVTTFMALLVKSTGLMLKAQIANRINFFTMQLQLVSSEVSANLRTRTAKGEAAA